eukprot:TRINITY_DN3669_c0_g2_i1.p1 TRINITY_DN3669_c0_g2~~TRINITY_DN3669_c0_g2_i1.p1  ORF type:complete len:286 (+),score=88.83 TRINITY_DN3669_c0_g2_i1:68-925(+)
MAVLPKTVRLASGRPMPLHGLGTWASEGDSCKAAVAAGLAAGVRLLDTAQFYGNEEQVGAALKESGVPREEVFVVTKVHWDHHGAEKVVPSIRESLKKLGVEYVDLVLIHTPTGKDVATTWRQLVAARAAGLTKDIGVSNFGAAQLEGLKAAVPDAVPAVNQIELHPFFQQDETVGWCDTHGCKVMGFCPLARMKRAGDASTGVHAVAAGHAGLSEADVMLQWGVQRGFITIPKSDNPARVASNHRAMCAAALSDDDMARIRGDDVGFRASGASEGQDVPWDEVM